MSATTVTRVHDTTAQQSVARGVAGGLAGGIVFGALMQALGMIGMIAMMVGSESLAVAWAVHLAISAFFGAVFGAVVGPRLQGWSAGILSGTAYGALLWVVGPLLLMPAKMGMPLFTVDTMALQSLGGHLVYGAVLGAVVIALRQSRLTDR